MFPRATSQKSPQKLYAMFLWTIRLCFEAELRCDEFQDFLFFSGLQFLQHKHPGKIRHNQSWSLLRNRWARNYNFLFLFVEYDWRLCKQTIWGVSFRSCFRTILHAFGVFEKTKHTYQEGKITVFLCYIGEIPKLLGRSTLYFSFVSCRLIKFLCIICFRKRRLRTSTHDWPWWWKVANTCWAIVRPSGAYDRAR